ncbi:hypothetical protein LX32DRAFT_494308, partial [Colletotrichum zoysiae]
MTEISFSDFRNKIKAEEEFRYKGSASIKIDRLRFPNHNEDIDTEGLEKIFRAERGSRYEDPKNHIFAIVKKEDFETALKSAHISESRLLGLPYVELEFERNVTIECLEGRRRIEAAKKVFKDSANRWVVDILLDDASPLTRTYINDGLHFKKGPSDGDYYCKIRGYQGISGKKMPILERMWLAHMSAAVDHKRKRFDQLCNSRTYLKSFDNLLMIPALFSAFQLGSMHTMIARKCPEPIIRYLENIFITFNFICHGKRVSTREEAERLGESAVYRLYNIDKTTIENIQGTAPGMNLEDRNRLYGQVSSGELFKHLSDDERKAAFERMCTETEQRPIPSLKTFFDDKNILLKAAESLRTLMDYTPEVSIDDELYQRLFTCYNHQSNRCVIQVAAGKFGNVSCDSSAQSHLSLIQMWLAAFRLC